MNPGASALPRGLTVLRAAPQMLVQDGGRPGHAHLGVAPSGALDLPALRAANLLLGNQSDTAGVEILLGGARLRADRECWIAVTGAVVDIRVDGVARPHGTALLVPAGATVALGRVTRGLRCYLALRGGVLADPVLGSGSTDVLSGLGPAPLTTGDTICPAVIFGGSGSVSPVRRGDRVWPVLPRADQPIQVHPGPRLDHIGDAGWRGLLGGGWTVTPESNRIGLRLNGEPLQRLRSEELPSEGLVTGAVQLPPSGQPVIFLADHPATGGYPVVAVVDRADLPLAGQLRPGARITLTAASA